MSITDAAAVARNNTRGVLAMLASCAFFVLGDACVKALGKSLPLGEILLLRGCVSAPIVIVMAHRAGVLPLLPKTLRNPLVIWRTLMEVILVMLFLLGIINMGYANAVGIQQSLPLVAMAGAAIFLGESVGWRRWLAAGIGFAGVLIIIRQGIETLNWPAFAILGSVLATAIRDLITRRLTTAIPSLVLTTLSVASVGLSGFLLAPFEDWHMPTAREAVLVVAAALNAIGGFYFMIEALRRGEVSAVLPFRYSLVPLGAIMGLALFNEWPDTLSLAGIAVVLCAGLYALQRERGVSRR
ncbi:MAG: DMT family transporter [Hyphomicrobiaceae bacterium]